MQAITQSLQPRMRSLSGMISTRFRLLTWKNRALPNFIIAGAQKSGTTSLFYYLAQHPDLKPSCTKEVHFFDGGYRQGERNGHQSFPHYQAYFPLRILLTRKQRVFEASPSYLFHPLAPNRIFDVLPNIKLIMLLRNPVERAISHYLHEKRSGHEPLGMMDALLSEEERLKPVQQSKDFDHISFRRYSYKSRGIYLEQLQRYFKVFTGDQILIICSESFFADVHKYLAITFGFVGVDPAFRVRNLQPKNVAPNRKNVGEEVYDYLRKFYNPYNEQLYEFLGQDFGW